jgi:hypothetical protein
MHTPQTAHMFLDLNYSSTSLYFINGRDGRSLERPHKVANKLWKNRK